MQNEEMGDFPTIIIKNIATSGSGQERQKQRKNPTNSCQTLFHESNSPSPDENNKYHWEQLHRCGGSRAARTTLRTNQDLLPCEVTEVTGIPPATWRRSRLALSPGPALHKKGFFIIRWSCFVIYSQMSLPAGAAEPALRYSLPVTKGP